MIGRYIGFLDVKRHKSSSGSKSAGVDVEFFISICIWQWYSNFGNLQ